MEMANRKGAPQPASRRNPSRDTYKMLASIIPHKRRRRHYVRFTREFWEAVGFLIVAIMVPVLYMMLQMLGEAIG